MNTRELVAGACAEHAKRVLQQARAANQNMAAVVEDLKRLAAAPASFVDDAQYGALAQQLVGQIAARDRFRPRVSDAPYQVWGADLEADALTQMRNACKLPVAVTGALMPDAHVGYGLPIGGVLATKDAVIP
jgi:tRNA-splicing ligase RtcB